MVVNQEIDVVISGIGGYFPKSKNIEEFTNVLFNQEDVVTKARWEAADTDNPDLVSNVQDIDHFDASFFGIHRLQTVFMDPLSRMALENTFEALLDAGINPVSIRGKKVAVIIGSTLSENDSLMFESVENGFGVTGQARTMLANRISYWMNATGPSYSTDNSWLGGFQALKNGYEAIKYGQCEGVIIGGVNLAMNMFPHNLYKVSNFTSDDQYTKVFDEKASGYVRSEGVVMLYLQPADTARRQYASILDIDIMYNGKRSGNYTKMNMDSARNFLTNFYKDAGVDPTQVEYIEAHGAAIKPLDEFELNLLDSFFNRSKDNPLLVGSVKSNIGHSEAASTLMSIVKTIIAMEKREIPANLSYETPNSKIPALREGRIKVVTEHTPWSGTLAAVNGFGITSSYGHLLLKSNAKTMKKEEINSPESNKLPHLYVLSTRTEDGMREIIDKMKTQTSLNDQFMRMINDIFYNHVPGHLHRGYLVSRYDKEIIRNVDEISHYSGSHRPIWFMYSGMGSQWISMGKDLLRFPIFAATIAKCHATLEPHGINLTEIITSTKNPDLFNNILNSFVGIAAIQIGLTDILHELGIKPDFMIGHSVGELGCAYADGCLTAEQMILSAYYRGRASKEVELIPGLMAAVGMGATKMKELLPQKVDIACRNGPDSCTISGPADIMTQLVSTLQASGIFARLVDVAGIAYHSRYIKPAAPRLLNYLKDLIKKPKLRSSKWLSSSVPEANNGWKSELAQYASAEYLTNNLLSCVYFEEALTHVPNEAITIEIAPHGLLQAILKRSLDDSCVNIALTKRGEKHGDAYLLANLGKLYLAGVPLQISNLYKEDVTEKYTPVVCARGTPSLAPLVRWNHTETWRTGVDEFKDNSNSECTYMLDINSETFHDLYGHRIYKNGDDAVGEGTITVPITTYLPLICGILSNIRRLGHIVFEEVHFIRHRVIPEVINVYIPPFRIMTQRGTGIFEISDRYGSVASGRYILPTEQETLNSNEILGQNIGKKIDELSGKEVYREFSQRGHNFQHSFKAINKLEIYDGGMIANIDWKSGWHIFAAAMLQMNIFREGRPFHEPFDTYYIHSLAYSFSAQNTPKEGSNFNVVYNYATNKIMSTIMTICGPRCGPYKIEPNILVADKCYPVESTNELQTQLNFDKIGVVSVNEATFNVEDINSDLPWAMKLRELLKEDYYENIYLISRDCPTSGIDHFMAYIKTLQNGHLVKLIVTLDDSAPEFKSVFDPFYQPAFRTQNSGIALYSSGVWEFRSTITCKLGDQDSIRDDFSSVISEHDISRNIPHVNIRFVGINVKNVTPDVFQTIDKTHQNQLGIIDYSGIDAKSNIPIMGLAAINNNNNLTSDPILRWPVPKHWSLVDGATVPFAYTLAYYIFYELLEAKPGETILIHNGCSNLGQAMIRVAHSIGCFIYTTVGSEKQLSVLQNHMKMLHSGSIYYYTSTKFEMEVMNATRGDGVDLLINCLPGNNFKAGLRCVAAMGRVVHLIDEDQKKDFYNEKIGLGIFLNVCGLYGVRTSTILELPNETKKRLHDMILNALDAEKIIIPVRRNLLHDHETLQLENIASYLMSPTATGGIVIPIEDTLSKKSIISNNNDEPTHIIYGGEDIENSIRLTHWLATIYGATNIVFLTSHSRNTNDKRYIQRNLSIIKSIQPSNSIESIDVPMNKPDLVVKEILKQKISNIAGIIVLSNGNNQNDMSFITTIQSKLTAHIVLLDCVSNVHHVNLERYHTKNVKNVSFLRWDKKRRFIDVLRSLKAALKETTDIFVRRDNVEEMDTIVANFSFEDYCDILSTSIPSLLTWKTPVSDIMVEQIISNCPKRMSECPPVFLVPGLLGSQCIYLQTAVKHIMSPVYVLDSDYSKSLDDLAIRLGEQVSKIYPNGPYNIIGISTGGALAIELAKHLEIDDGYKVQLYLIDGIPETIQNLVSEENKIKNGFEMVLLKHLLNIDDPKVLALLKNAPPNWKTRTEAILQQSVKKEKQIHLLSALKQRLDAVLTYTPNSRIFNGITRLLKPIDSATDVSKVNDICKQVKVDVIKGNHFTMLQTYKLVDYINNNIIVPTVYE